MLKEKFMKFFLAFPVLNSILNIFIDFKYRKYSIKSIIFFHNPFKRKANLSNYKNLEEFDWLIQISAPKGQESKLWGDTYFAEEIKNSLVKLNQKATIVHRDQNLQSFIKHNSVVLTIRGLIPLSIPKETLNIIWIISHPDQITKKEVKKYDAVFAASSIWAQKKSDLWKISINPLLQATNPKVFNTKKGMANSNNNFLFVGNTRGQFRKSLKILSKLNLDLRVIGTGWEKFLPSNKITGKFIANDALAIEYREAKVVLADHWEDMSKNGFVSNRLFDAVASGARVISDSVMGIKEIFGSSVVQFNSPEQLIEIVGGNLLDRFGNQTELDSNAKKIQSEHNFDIRAQKLLEAAKKASSGSF